MNFSAAISGINAPSVGDVLKKLLSESKDSALGIASAFVTVGGFRDLLSVTKKRPSLECRLLAGISNAVTHPQALIEAVDAGWKVKMGSASQRRIFHPKIILGGQSFLDNGYIEKPSFVYVGSSNLTRGGLHNNIECGVLGDADFAAPGLSACFGILWAGGEDATQSRIQAYAQEFSRRNLRRTIADIEAFGVSDEIEPQPKYEELVQKGRQKIPKALPETAATASWVGLESFTGEYRFQVEFPQAAGLVARGIIKKPTKKKVAILCSSDNLIRKMSYLFYADNGMFRLNIPNDTPGVQEARKSHKGIALIENSDHEGADAVLTILPPGPKLDRVVQRSVLFGTWGSTSTRSYGWF
jgi:HKD family nuclease